MTHLDRRVGQDLGLLWAAIDLARTHYPTSKDHHLLQSQALSPGASLAHCCKRQPQTLADEQFHLRAFLECLRTSVAVDRKDWGTSVDGNEHAHCENDGVGAKGLDEV